MSAEVLRDLARAKAVFQLRAIETVIQAPAIAMAPKAETEGLRGLSPAKRGAKQSPKVSR